MAFITKSLSVPSAMFKALKHGVVVLIKMGVQVSKNINNFHIALAMSPMQMDINYPLNIGK